MVDAVITTQNLKIDLKQVAEFEQVLRKRTTPIVKDAWKASLTEIGKYDINHLRATQLSGPPGLRSNKNQFRNSFKYKVYDDGPRLDQLKLSEYTRARPAEAHERGGVLRSKRAGGYLMIWNDALRTARGSRKYQKKTLAKLRQEEKIQVIPTKRGAVVVRNYGGMSKSGKLRKGTRQEIIGWLVKSIRLRKRLSFFENHENNKPIHDKIMSDRFGEAMGRLVKE